MANLFNTLSKPAISLLPPETSHELAIRLLRPRPIWRLIGRILATHGSGLDTDLAGIQLPNPIGLAAGFDKDCRVLGSLLDLGFGFAVGGTVTLEPRTGNPGPRLLRNPASKTLVNSMGFPGKGVEFAVDQLKHLSKQDRKRIFISVSGQTEDQIGQCYRQLEPLAAGIEINISSPNTVGLTIFHQPERLWSLVNSLPREHEKPCFIKMPRLLDYSAVGELASAAVDAGADGVIMANTSPIRDSRLAVGHGGLSGATLIDSTLESLVKVRDVLPAHIPVIACGGIASAATAKLAMDAGATAVQIYTALVYDGPGLPGNMVGELISKYSL